MFSIFFQLFSMGDSKITFITIGYDILQTAVYAALEIV